MLIQGVNVNVYINNIDITGLLSYATIVEDVTDLIPTCEITFLADPAFLSDSPIVDGSIIKISLNQGDFIQNSTFRTYNLTLKMVGTYIQYTIFGLLDVYPLVRSGWQYALNNFSSEVFKKVATSLKLTPVIDQTHDSQLWVSSSMNTLRWLSNVCSHGYIDDNSCMVWTITRNHELLYRNISQIIQSSDKDNVVHLKPSTGESAEGTRVLTYKNAIPVFNSGPENISCRGYGGDDLYFNFMEYKENSFSASQVVASSNMLNINKELSQGLDTDFFAMDVGNFHPNYYKAYAQNKRQLGTYSTYMHVESESWAPLRLYDFVHLTYQNTATVSYNQQQAEKFTLNGHYFVKRLVTTINNTFISLAVDLMGQGYNSTNSTETY